jgi:hypothetical protein
MAYAGTPGNLAKQPATSTSNGLLQAVLAAVVLFALVAGMVFVGTSIASKASVVPAADRGYDQIEAQRGATNFAAVKADRRFDELILAPAVHYPDVSYDQVTLSAPTKISGTAPDNRPGRIVGHRGAMIDQ